MRARALRTAGLIGGAAVAATLGLVPILAPPATARSGSTVDLVSGWVWANQPTTSSYTPATAYQYNSTSGVDQITRQGVGTYSVTFLGLGAAPFGDKKELGTVQVTAYDSGGNCKVEDWGADGANEVVSVVCFNLTGQPADSEFDASFTNLRPHEGPGGLVAYAWANQPTVASYKPATDYQQANWSTSAASIKRSGVGTYQVSFPSYLKIEPSANGGTVAVTAYGSEAGGTCQTGGWDVTSKKLVINVTCASVTGAAADLPFTVGFASGNDIQGVNAVESGYVWGNQDTTPSYTPNTSYSADQVSGGGARGVTITRSGPGLYAVDFLNASDPGGDVLVTAYGSTTARCTSGGWNPTGSDEVAQVTCTTPAGHPVDSEFTLQWVGTPTA